MKARTWIVVGAAGVVTGAAVWALWPKPLAVETAAAVRAPLRVTVEGPGRARVRDRFVVASPVAGHLGRVAVRAGDAVREGAVVAVVHPATPAPLDERTRRELTARLEAARAAEAQARAAEERARHALAQAERERTRARSLAAAGSMTARDLDAAELAAEAGDHEVEMARQAVLRAGRETEATQALLSARVAPAGKGIEVRSPASGRVLRVLQESEGPVAAGTPLLEVGDPERIELRLDLLTSEAVRVRPGVPVDLVNWGGDGPLPGRVRMVEPSAFTKVSALGVEEQRVYVLVDPAAPGAWAPLSDGYAADGRVVVAEKADALQVPPGALFRSDGGWALLVVEGGKARVRPVRVGDTGARGVEVTEGLTRGERVIVHPSDRVGDGVRVRDAGGPPGASRDAGR
ncbi:MAG TPA: HlyD family efflux transporter periplasmic adaptor subunit [Anaeromyxobacteraceae bacterium]|nr:HlyD family efflux transporter periplasmic adaptor subunit [Anaeromyxobacteraceae bacterium]